MKKKRETVVLHGSKQDPAIQQSMKRIQRAGRKVVVTPAPGHDTGQGNCGKQCSCTEGCAMAYTGDDGATMGASF